MAAVRRYNVPFTMAWQMRVDPQNIEIKHLLQSGQLGQVFMVRRRHALGTHLWDNFPGMWHAKPELNRDIWADDAAHAIDFIHYLLGVPETVTAEMATLHDPRVPMDNGIAIFRYPGGPLAEVTCSFVCPAAENTVEVVAEKGTIIQNYGDVPSCNVPRPAGACGQKWYTVDKADWTCSEIASPANHGVRIAGLAAPLADFVQGRRAPIATAEEGRMTLRMTLATYVSTREGRRVEIGDPTIDLGVEEIPVALPIAPLITLNRAELRDKIYGCWLGKNIGGTLGGPYETRRDILDIQGYLTAPGEPLANDDLDLQLVWLKAVQERGPLGVTAAVLGEYWLNYVSAPWSEYGTSKANQRAGLAPPLSGMYNNPWKDSNGAWIRSEIWACLAPGCPDVAIRLAYEDAAVDHGGAEGMYAELFTAAVESAAFVVSDRDALIRIGLSKIPATCRVARAIRVAMEAHAQGRTWQEAREAVVADSVPDLGWLMAPANVAFFVIGWLYGQGDFGLSVRIAANCGDDTDCTAATMGALLGIIRGRQGIPPEWTEPLGDRIITVSIDCGSYLDYPRTLADLTERVMEQVAPHPGGLSLPRADR